jgi:ribosome-binding factor A
MATRRVLRLNEAIREELADLLRREMRDPRLNALISITEVETTPDLATSRVYFSVLGTPDEREASLEGLRSAHGYLQRQVARELRLKHTPELNFILDDTAERAFRVEALLDAEEPQE